jgi:hypothetical protein
MVMQATQQNEEMKKMLVDRGRRAKNSFDKHQEITIMFLARLKQNSWIVCLRDGL